MTVQELIDKLEEFDPKSIIMVQASCCPNPHDINGVDFEWDTQLVPSNVIIDATA